MHFYLVFSQYKGFGQEKVHRNTITYTLWWTGRSELTPRCDHWKGSLHKGCAIQLWIDHHQKSVARSSEPLLENLHSTGTPEKRYESLAHHILSKLLAQTYVDSGRQREKDTSYLHFLCLSYIQLKHVFKKLTGAKDQLAHTSILSLHSQAVLKYALNEKQNTL